MIDWLHIIAQTFPTSLPSTVPTVGAAAQPAPHAAAAASPFFAFYAANLRGSFFSGFLTLGSFLVAVNTFIVVNLKKELYDHDGYRTRVEQRRLLNSKVSYFGPLQRLSAFLFWTIILAVVTAVAQLTVGVIFQSTAAAVVCVSLAGCTIITLFVALFTIKFNLKLWFGFIEEEAKKKSEEKLKGGGSAEIKN